MKTLHVLLLSLFAFQVLLLFASTPTQATPLGYSAGWNQKVMSLKPHPRRHSPPPPTPGYSPEPGPGRTQKSPPTPFIVAQTATSNSLLHKESPFNPSAASA